MATLYFKVASDWEEVVRLREEVSKLEAKMKSFGRNTPESEVKSFENKLKSTKTELVSMVTEAAKAGAVIDNDFKKKIHDASQSVNGFTEKIIAQKNVVKDVEYDVRRLAEAYQDAKKNNPLYADGKLSEWKSAKKVLEEEKTLLFSLTQERATAQLSVKKLRDEYALMNDSAKGSTDVLEEMTKKLQKWGKSIVGGIGLKEFVGNVVKVRGEFQSADTAIKTLLGSEEKANNLLSKIREFAKVSPLEFSDVTQATQMMLGFNIEAEKVSRYISAIGDISMGETGKFNSLTLAFSQMSAAGKLMGQDLNQMINAGFNPLQVISEKTGKSIATLKTEMSKGAISAEMVQEAFINAASAGGKFYQMSENAAKTINGQISMLHDALDSMFNEIGKQSEDVIKSGIEFTTELIENYEKVGKILVGLISTYGAYKTAVIAVTAVQSLQAAGVTALTAKEAIHYAWLVATRKATLALNSAMLLNPYVLVTVAVAGTVAAIWALHDSTTAAEAAQRSFNETEEKAKKKAEEHKREVENLISVANDESKSRNERRIAMDKLIQMYPSIIQKYIDEEGHLKNILQMNKEISEMQGRQDTTRLKKNYENDKTRLDFINKLLGMSLDERNKYLGAEGNQHLSKWYFSLVNEANRHGKKVSAYVAGSTAQLAGTGDLELLRDFYSNRAQTNKTAYGRSVTEEKVNKFTETLKDKSDKELEALVKELNSAGNKLGKKDGKNFGYTYVNSIGDYLTSSDIEILKTKAEGISAARKAPKDKSYYTKERDKWQAVLDSMDRSKIDSKEWKEAVKKRDAAEKLINPEKSGKKEEKESQKAAERVGKSAIVHSELEMLLEKQSRERIHLETELAFKEEQNRIDLEKDASKRMKMQRSLDNKKELSEIKSQKEAAIQAEIERQKAVFDKREQEKDSADENYVKKSFSKDDINYDEIKKITDSYDNIIEQTKKLQQKRESDLIDEELRSINEYLKEYGTLQEKKLAITQLYAEKINEAKTSGEKKTLEAERDKEISNLDFSEFKKGIKWEDVFGDLNKISMDGIDRLCIKIREYIDTQKDLSPDKIKELVEAVNKMDAAIASRNPFSALSASMKNLSEKSKAFREANAAYKKIAKTGTEEEKKASKKAYDEAKNDRQKARAETTDKLHASTDKAGEILETGNNLMNLVDTIGIKPPEWMADYLEGTGEVLEGLGEIDLNNPVSIINGGIKALSGAIKTIGSLGGAFDWNGSNAAEVANTMARLTERNETLTKAIDNLRDTMDKTAGRESITAYKDAMKYQKEVISNTMEKARAQAGYHNQHHSWQSYMEWSPEIISWINSNVKSGFSGTESLWGLTPEEMKRLLGNVDVVDAINTAGKGGYGGRVLAQLEEYAELAGILEELTDQINESVTQISFDSLKENFRSTLMDMKSDTKDFAEDWKEIIQKAMLNFALGDQLDNEIKKLYENLSSAMQTSNGRLTEGQIEAFAEEYDALAEKGMQIRDEIARITGYKGDSSSSGSDSGSKGYTATASQDSIDRVEGRVTGIQISCEQIRLADEQRNSTLNLVTAKLDDIIELSQNIGIKDVAAESRDYLVKSYLELQQINENTRNSSNALNRIDKNISEIKNATKNF